MVPPWPLTLEGFPGRNRRKRAGPLVYWLHTAAAAAPARDAPQNTDTMSATPTTPVSRAEPPAGLRKSLGRSCTCLSWIETPQDYSPRANPREELQLGGLVGRHLIGYRPAAEIVSPGGIGRLEPGKTETTFRISLVHEGRMPGALVLSAPKVQDRKP